MLTEIEKDFVEFLSFKNGYDILPNYLETKKSFDFGSKEFNALGIKNYQVLRVFFNDRDDSSTIDAYKYFAYQDLLRMLSYSFRKPPTLMGYIRTGIKKIKNREEIRRSNKKRVLQEVLHNRESPIVVDYGCGLGYLSFEIIKCLPQSKIILVDIDSIKLEFAIFRFKKYNVDVTAICVTKENPYPLLPVHDICIAEEVMEHLRNPLLAYSHIYESMNSGGYLIGDFSDHKDEIFHISPSLVSLRHSILKDYDKVDINLYRKR